MKKAILVFDENNCLRVKPSEGKLDAYVQEGRGENFLGEFNWCNEKVDLYIEVVEATASKNFFCWNDLVKATKKEKLAELINLLEPHLINISYRKFKFSKNQYIYRFRSLKERNKKIYQDAAKDIYQSRLCSVIKSIKRLKEKVAEKPIFLNFNAVEYVLPSHFGFCLGVQNAIEKAYETLFTYPQKKVYMLSELIHNPFVNNDLNQRGLHYLQTDKGEWLNGSGEIVSKEDAGALWNKLSPGDIVIIPAFGATDEDKKRLIKKGIQLKNFDATCMLVEKVWKSIKEHGEEGYTTIIHGKHYHEETKATFSNAIKYGPALIISDLEEAKILGEILNAPTEEKKQIFNRVFNNRCSDNFDPSVDLEKIAVVNQTTLLKNHTLIIIDYLKEIMIKKHGEKEHRKYIWISEKGDTLCYATQVNQDALVVALNSKIDLAIIVGGKNSSNTYQLYQICKKVLGDKAFYIQSEKNIISKNEIMHYNYSSNYNNREEKREFLPQNENPQRILITGGASCPDGIIQQVINRINKIFPKQAIRTVESVLEDLEKLLN